MTFTYRHTSRPTKTYQSKGSDLMKSQKNDMTMSTTTVQSCQPYLHMTEKVSDENGKENKQIWWVMKVRETGAMVMKFMI